ncbi:MAG: acyl-[acyl-carrier-protein]--UDP-N-acetylglucosamine O-acyltransferase, partial [Chlamydiae bacterium]|nr:acyl-[acyl-carrier-protein]--UDP-N-acetylglucosamine O-acyltransferase [Chlamydiota bacterium]
GKGYPYRVGGLNLIGLKRHNFSLEERRSLTKAFNLTYRSNLRVSEALDVIEKEVPMNAHVKHWVDFCRSSKRGLIGLQALVQGLQDEEESEDLVEEKV